MCCFYKFSETLSFGKLQVKRYLLGKKSTFNYTCEKYVKKCICI